MTSNLQEIERVLLQFNRLYQTRILQQDWLQCQLALVEGFTNAVRHAHRNLPPETPITISIAVKSDRLITKIWDYGEPFDLIGFIAQKVKTDNWLGSGRGTDLIGKIADEVSYDRVSPQQNCLKMTKYLR